MTKITCLSVSEDTSVVALKGIVQEVTSDRIEDYVLRRKVFGIRICREETMIERECLWLFPETKEAKIDKLMQTKFEGISLEAINKRNNSAWWKLRTIPVYIIIDSTFLYEKKWNWSKKRFIINHFDIAVEIYQTIFRYPQLPAYCRICNLKEFSKNKNS